MITDLREYAFAKIKESGRLDLWPKVRTELLSLENQEIQDKYLSAINRGAKCPNACNRWLAYFVGICDEEPQGNMEIVATPGLADIDCDYDMLRRDEVIEMIREMFGHENVTHIATYGQYRLKAAVQNVAKQLGVIAQDAIVISKSIPSKAANVEEALKGSEELRKFFRDYPDAQGYVEGILGVYSHIGVHAAGVVMAPQPVHTIVPLSCTTKKDRKGITKKVVTASMDMKDVEAAGLVKFDILGLANCSVMSKCLDLLEARTGKRLDLTSIPLDDPHCIKRFNAADVDSIFQFETPQFQKILRALPVTSFDDLIAIVAIGRPGSMKFISEDFYDKFRNQDENNTDPLISPIGTYSQNKSGEHPIIAPHPKMMPILAETYGIPIYQEQAMRIVQSLSGCSLKEADHLRKAIGKKIGSLFERCRQNFFSGCKANGIEDSVVADVWKLLEEFDKYSFNKSHSCAYAMIGYWNMWLRENFPLEWYAAFFTTQFSDSSSKKDLLEIAKWKINRKFDTKLEWYKDGARRHGVSVLKAEVNASDYEAVVIHNGKVYLPLSSINGVGESSSVTSANRPYANIEDFVRRCGLSPSLVKTLIESEACRSMGRSPIELQKQADFVYEEIKEGRRSKANRMRKTNSKVAPQFDDLFGETERSIKMAKEKI